MPFEPEDLPPAELSFFEDVTDQSIWTPVYRHGCTFTPEIFSRVMMNMVENPNLNSSWLFRADILYDDGTTPSETRNALPAPEIQHKARRIPSIPVQRTLIRKLIPRNERRDNPLDQTCTFHKAEAEDGTVTSLVIYIPHADRVAELPFYHPKVQGIAHMHRWDPNAGCGTISVHFLSENNADMQDTKLRRVAFHLLEILHKHGNGSASGYVKRVQHDVVISQARFQDRYASLKAKYGRQLVKGWEEATDPVKHVFEDLGIAAFLLELWDDMYKGGSFPGFIDIGCGNGLLVYILNQEGCTGWGFDARARKSWAQYTVSSSASPSGKSLEERLLLPSILSIGESAGASLDPNKIHDGVFKKGTFIVSNHADELTPWTPILGAMSECPFIMIPCCSHNLTGEKFRAPPPKDKTKGTSTFASLVGWVTHVAEDCGWETETEMLRIPSTRNTCILGRKRTADANNIHFEAIISKYGGVAGYYDNVAKLVKTGPRSH